MKKKLTGFLLVLSLIAANLLTAGTAKAASLDTYQGNAPSSIVLFTYGTSATTGKVQTIRTKKIPSYAKQVKAVSANKKIATVSVQKNKYGKSYYYAFEIAAHQAGTTKIKLTANVKGKQATDYTNVKVVKYQNPVSSFKIGSKEYASKFSKYPASNVKANFTNKETKIIVYSAWVKEHCLFKDSSLYQKKSDYGKMMDMLCSYTVAGKNKHDDVPDGMAMLAEYAQSLSGQKVEVFKRPW